MYAPAGVPNGAVALKNSDSLPDAPRVPIMACARLRGVVGGDTVPHSVWETGKASTAPFIQSVPLTLTDACVLPVFVMVRGAIAPPVKTMLLAPTLTLHVAGETSGSVVPVLVA